MSQTKKRNRYKKMDEKEEIQKDRDPAEEGQTEAGTAGRGPDADEQSSPETDEQAGVGPQHAGGTGAAGTEEQPFGEEVPVPGPSEIGELKDQAEQLSKESALYKDKWLRAEAEMDNYKKRIHKDRVEQLKYGYETLIRELLPVMDNLERAIEYSKKHSQKDSLSEGVELTFKMLKRVMESFGVSAVETVGKPFDPNFHEGLGVEESDRYDDNIIVREVEKGYLYHDRLLRPAKVIVGKKSLTEKVSE